MEVHVLTENVDNEIHTRVGIGDEGLEMLRGTLSKIIQEYFHDRSTKRKIKSAIKNGYVRLAEGNHVYLTTVKEYTVFVPHDASFTRAKIARQLNKYLKGGALPKRDWFKKDDARLTDEVCQKYADEYYRLLKRDGECGFDPDEGEDIDSRDLGPRILKLVLTKEQYKLARLEEYNGYGQLDRW